MIHVIETPPLNVGSTLINWIYTNTANSKTVVELGAGFFDRLQFVHPNVIKKIGIEIWQPYIDNAKYNNCIKIQGDVFNYKALISCTDDFDTVMIIDVLEHFEKNDGINLIKMLKKDFKQILLMVPEGIHPQDTDVTGYGAHQYQKHRSTWYDTDVESLLEFNEILSYKKFHSQPGKDTGCVFAKWAK